MSLRTFFIHPMFAEAFPQISASPSLVWVVSAICFQMINVLLGAFMAFQRKSPGLIRAHRFLYFAILFSLGYYLVLNGVHLGNSVWDYLIFLYFITVIPLSKRWDVLAHAFFALMGLTFLPVLILLQL